MASLLTKLGFSGNPFEKYVAENEPDIDKYFVRPPYFNAVQQRAKGTQSFILFGARGAGKSATRLALYKHYWSLVGSNPQGQVPLVVNFDSFGNLIGSNIKLAEITLTSFTQELTFLVLESLLVWLASLSDADRHLYTGGLTSEEERVLDTLIRKFYLVRPELARNVSATETMRLLNVSLKQRTVSWVNERWSSLAGLIGSIASAFTRKADPNLDVSKNVEQILTVKNAKPDEMLQHARAILEKALEAVKVFGFSGIIVLVDKVDETMLTTNSAESSAQLLFPVLAHTQLLEIPNLGLMFFLWDRVRDHFNRGGKYEIRLDKIAKAEISWEQAYLRNLVDQRIIHFSDGAVQHFGSMLDPQISLENTYRQIIQIAQSSPREMIRILDTILREHDERYAQEEEAPLINQESIDMGLDVYCAASVKDFFPDLALRQLVKLNAISFINRDVQTCFRVNDDTARNRIRAWSDTGLVKQIGTRQAEGGLGGKPAHEFAVVDARMKRIIERKLFGDFAAPPEDDSNGETAS